MQAKLAANPPFPFQSVRAESFAKLRTGPGEARKPPCADYARIRCCRKMYRACRILKRRNLKKTTSY